MDTNQKTKTMYRHTLYHKNPYYSYWIDCLKERCSAWKRETCAYHTDGWPLIKKGGKCPKYRPIVG